MSSKLFVGGLSWGTDDQGLRAAFERFGEVREAKVILDRETGRSRGFGFVTFTEPEPAQTAISEMDGAEVDGRRIRVNEAQERAPRRSGGPGGPRGGGYGRGGGGGGGGFDDRRGGGGFNDGPPRDFGGRGGGGGDFGGRGGGGGGGGGG
ncbi:MAG: RNA-binding protein, partial [Myxococcota bacterium]